MSQAARRHHRRGALHDRMVNDRDPRVSASRRFETSLKCLKCANCDHAPAALRTGEVDPLLTYPVSPVPAENAVKRP
jgi:hypothetical protein